MNKLRLQTFVNFDFRKLNKQLKPTIKDIVKKKMPEVAVKQFKDNIKNFKGKPLQDSTINIRRTRKNNPNKGVIPLQDTGNLLKSIKKVNGGVSILKYGEFQNDGFFTKKKSLIRKVVEVPPRQWIPEGIDIDKKTQNELFSRLMKVLRIKTRKIADTKVSI